jgi:hypothetical protein
MTRTLLYPQFLNAKATAFENRVKSITELAQVDSVMPLDRFWFSPTGGSKVTVSHLRHLQNGLRALACECGYPTPSSRLSHRIKFDSESAIFLYEKMGISASEAANDGVWNFMTSVLVPDLVRWRFFDAEGTTLDRYLHGPKNMLERVWWRAKVLHDVCEEDPWGLLKSLGEDEMVNLFERPTLGRNGQLPKVVARTFLTTVDRYRKLPRSEFFRELQKRLMRYTPYIDFTLMDVEQISAFVAGISEDLVQQAFSQVLPAKETDKRNRGLWSWLRQRSVGEDSATVG